MNVPPPSLSALQQVQHHHQIQQQHQQQQQQGMGSQFSNDNINIDIHSSISCSSSSSSNNSSSNVACTNNSRTSNSNNQICSTSNQSSSSTSTSSSTSSIGLKRKVTNDSVNAITNTVANNGHPISMTLPFPSTPSNGQGHETNNYTNAHAPPQAPRPSPNSFEVMKKMKVLDKPLRSCEYQESIKKASAALALSALFSGSGSGVGNDTGTGTGTGNEADVNVNVDIDGDVNAETDSRMDATLGSNESNGDGDVNNDLCAIIVDIVDGGKSSDGNSDNNVSSLSITSLGDGNDSTSNSNVDTGTGTRTGVGGVPTNGVVSESDDDQTPTPSLVTTCQGGDNTVSENRFCTDENPSTIIVSEPQLKRAKTGHCENENYQHDDKPTTIYPLSNQNDFAVVDLSQESSLSTISTTSLPTTGTGTGGTTDETPSVNQILRMQSQNYTQTPQQLTSSSVSTSSSSSSSNNQNSSNRIFAPHTISTPVPKPVNNHNDTNAHITNIAVAAPTPSPNPNRRYSPQYYNGMNINTGNAQASSSSSLVSMTSLQRHNSPVPFVNNCDNVNSSSASSEGMRMNVNNSHNTVTQSTPTSTNTEGGSSSGQSMTRSTINALSATSNNQSNISTNSSSNQSMTRATINALYKNRHTPSTKRNYTAIYPRLNPIYMTNMTPGMVPGPSSSNSSSASGNGSSNGNINVPDTASTHTMHHHHHHHGPRMVNGAVTPSPRHAPNSSRINVTSMGMNNGMNNGMTNINVNNPLPSTVPSSTETATYQQHHHHHHHHHHHVMNGVVGAGTPSGSSFVTPAKCQSMNRNNAVEMPSPMTSLEFTPNTHINIQPAPLSSNIIFKNTSISSSGNTYNRKDKSLGLLCENFIKKYTIHFYEEIKEMKNGSPQPALSIDEAAKSLCVERRRIYDIINILEAIHVVKRKCKNMYYWFGLGDLTETFRHLQREGLDVFKDDAKKNGFILNQQQTVLQQQQQMADPNFSPSSIRPSGLEMLLAADQVHSQTKTKKKKVTSCTNSKKIKSQNAKEKSLAKLSQKFIQLFLVGNDVIAMNDASDKILGPTIPKSPEDCDTKEEMAKVRAANSKLLKTKIRRLYDVANVLVSIGIIQKLNGGNNMNNALKHRPSFKWVYKVTPEELLRLQHAEPANSKFHADQYA